jgi:prolipoprotein diacylglyceryltransferase
LWIAIALLKKRGLSDGAMFKLFLISYLSYRFMIEFLKENNFTLWHLSVIQIACLAGLIYYLPTILNPKKIFLQNA